MACRKREQREGTRGPGSRCQGKRLHAAHGYVRGPLSSRPGPALMVGLQSLVASGDDFNSTARWSGHPTAWW